MQPRRSLLGRQWGSETSGHHQCGRSRSCVQQSTGTPRRHPAEHLRRQIVVSELFKHVQEILSLEHGYALQFDRSDDLQALLGTIAEYIVLESLNSSQFTVMIDEVPETNGFWLRVRYEGAKRLRGRGIAPSVP